MDYLTVKQVAELKKCSERYVQKLVKNGELQAEEKLHPQNNQACYMIPVSALSENLQAKYYQQKRTEVSYRNVKSHSVCNSRRTVSESRRCRRCRKSASHHLEFR